MTRKWFRYAAVVAVGVLIAGALAGCGAQGSGGASGGAGQHFSVDLSSGSYQPNEITAKAGEPVSITFGQGQGCVQRLVFPSFNIATDLSQGPKTFDLGSLKPGDYRWSCGMNMQHGVLHVR